MSGTRRWATVVVGCSFIVCALGAGSAPLEAARFRHLKPGKPADLRERVPVNVVFVGIERDEVDPKAIVRRLPRSTKPTNRVATYYREEPRFLGLTYSYDYRLRFAPASYEDAFFRFLARSARRAPLTRWQKNYNDQPLGVLDIDENHYVDAPSVERWLARHPPSGVDTRRNTVFLIDWYGRRDFRFHVYQKRRDPDSDYNGFLQSKRDTELYVAWGGTAADDPEDGHGLTRRVWFYDLSAGPDFYTNNWDVTLRDVDPRDHETRPDQRIPPSWEYSDRGYRDPSDLTADVAGLLRYVAVDALFTPSPLYPVLVTDRGHPPSIDLHMNFYDLPGLEMMDDGSEKDMLSAIRRLVPWIRFSSERRTADMVDAEHLACLAHWSVLFAGVSCGLSTHGPNANLVAYHSKHRRDFFDADAAYQAGTFVYHTPGVRLHELVLAGFVGECYAYADDDWATGAQSFVFLFLGPSCEQDVGWTDWLTHEYGHHLGLSHPHDGFDYLQEAEFYPRDATHFTWAGTEVNSAMSYTAVNNDFSQFDVDNVARWTTEAYVRSANVLAGRIGDAKAHRSALQAADELVGRAADAISEHRYRDAATAAVGAYARVLASARAAGVRLDTPSVGSVAVLGAPPSTRPSGRRSDGDLHAGLVDRICGRRFCR